MLSRVAFRALRAAGPSLITSQQLVLGLEAAHRWGQVTAVGAPGASAPSALSYAAAFSKEAKQKSKAKSHAATEPETEFKSADVLQELKRGMEKALEYLQHELSGVRTGRASPGLLEPLQVNAHGEHLPLKACGAVIVRNNQTLAVAVYDPALVDAVVSAIEASPLDLRPSVEKGEIVVPVPRASQDVLSKMAKLVKKEAEDAKISVRHARQKALDAGKKSGLTKDELKKFEREVQKLHDDYVKKVDLMRAAKEKDLQEHH